MTTKKTAPVKAGASTSKKAPAKKPVEKKDPSVKQDKKDPAPTPVDTVDKKQVISDQVTSSASPKEKTVEVIANGLHRYDGPAIVIPYIAKAADGIELLYAIRAWEKHLPGVQIILIGDTMPELNDKVIHIPHKPTSENPQIDTSNKMAAAIASDLVPAVFVWSNDDIYCVSDIQEADLMLLKAMPGGMENRGGTGSLYRENADRTRKALKAKGVGKIFDYDTHTPVVFEKEKLAEILATFKCTKEGHLVSSLYFNTHFPTIRPVILNNTGFGSIVASVFKENPNPKVMPTIFDTQKWVNNNPRGWRSVEPYLAKLFPEKSAFEK